MDEMINIAVSVNGKSYTQTVSTRLLLSDFLRDVLGLTGTHVGCEHGVCGACTVLLEGKPVRSCLMFAVQAQGARITTVEQLGTIDKLHPIQRAFQEKHGLQCGFCTPGMLMTATAFLESNRDPTRDEVREAISGNLCRCTGYQNIVDAIMYGAELLRAEKES